MRLASLAEAAIYIRMYYILAARAPKSATVAITTAASM